MSDDEDSPTSRLKGNEPNTDPESGYSKLFKNKMGSRRSYNIILTLVIFIFAVLTISVFGLSYAYLAAVNQDLKKPCTTEDCLRSATSFVESMNKSVDPCDNFYQYACGNYGNLHRIPKTSLSNDRFAEVHASMMIFIRDFMEKDDSDTEPYSVSQSRLLYRSCMATDEMDSAGLKPLLKVLDQIGLPHLGFMTKTSRIKDINLSQTFASIKKHLNIDYLFTTSIEPDPKNRTVNRLALSKPRDSNLFPAHKITEKMRKTSSRKIRETLASEEKVENENDGTNNEEGKEYLKSYGKYFKSALMEIFKSKLDNTPFPSVNELAHKIAQLLTFTNELTEIKDKIYDTDDQLPIEMSVDELQSMTDNITEDITKVQYEVTIDWRQYFTVLFEDVENTTLDFDTDFIQINNIEYFEDLFKTLVKFRKNQIVLNVWWEVVSTIIPYTTNQMRFIQDRFYYETTGIENNPSRSLYCASSVNTMMGMAVSHLLVDMKPLDRDKKMMIEMITNIRWAFEKIVHELKWMDETTKQRTLYKAQQMKTFIGYPEFINDPEQLDNYYSDYEVVENDYFGNVIRYVQRDLNNTLIELRSLNDYEINSWASDPLEVNAYNWIQANAITVPAGILQFPFFGHDLQVLNYGFLGSILGHELTHGFDNTGRKFDHDGNENMWWTNQTIEEYEKRTDCFIRHYESYLLPGVEEKISGKLTLDENIADNGGLREGLWAYRKFVADHGEEPKLPGLEDLSNEQIYFLAFANNWCEASTLNSLTNSLLDEHSPNYIRVIAGLTNSKEFSEVWKCAKGTKMNPQNDKCKIW